MNLTICGLVCYLSVLSSIAVEKAALVFSLKLDNGHKLLCPWINNACDESLAQFPPTPPPVLVNQFKHRYISLVQLSALPVISSSAIKSMTSPQMENFLRDFSTLKCGNMSPGLSLAKYTGDGYDQDSAILYYQVRVIPFLFCSFYFGEGRRGFEC